jgi:ATP-binding cassette, subfamily B, bacterial
MTQAWSELAWPLASLDRAFLELARTCRLSPSEAELPPISPDPARTGEWIALAADHAGLCAEAVDCAYEELPAVLGRIAPALVRITERDAHHYLAVVHSSARSLQVVTPAGRLARVRTPAVCAALSGELEALPHKRVDYLLDVATIRGRRARLARASLLGLYLSEARVAGLWILRHDPGASFTHQLRQSRVLARAAVALSASIGQVAITLYGWVLLGRAALTGVVEPGWLLAWILACLSALPLQAAAMQLGGRALNDTAALLKQRLLCGALRLDVDRIRTRGSGRLLAMVTESEAIETAGLGAVFALGLSLLQLASAGVILAFGAGGAVLVGLLVACSALTAQLVLRSWQRRSAWTEQRFDLANTLVEYIVGHRTRIAQQPSRDWHARDDQRLERYLGTCRTLDESQQALAVLPARIWFISAFAGLVATGWLTRAEPIALAIAIGGILQGYAAFSAFGAQCAVVGRALIAWRRVSELYRAAAHRPALGHPNLALAEAPPPSAAGVAREPLLELRSVSFGYESRPEPALRASSLVVRPGDRILLEGPSGGGKSTLTALLTGLRTPSSGQILLRGLDRTTLGAASWRKRIASAPQFHENHILSGTLAFNLLMGRSWPASESDRAEAEALCRELGLGPMIDRMPSKLNQVIGETGWQLSHGERSRLFLARALLQRAELVILDESFGALDPITLEQCLRAVLRRAPALMVIAHP